jgi:hypothetical protein
MLYLIDYENEDSLTILQNLLKKIRTLPPMRFIVLSNRSIRSWTKLLTPYINKAGILTDIVTKKLETYFPIEDTINGVAYSTILKMLYGM